MKLKPTDHIIMFVEKNDKIVEVINDFGSWICKATRCDYIFFVDELQRYDFFDVIDGIIMKCFIVPTDFVTFNKIKYEDGMKIGTIEYFKADWSASL